MINRIPLLKSFKGLTQYHDPQNTGEVDNDGELTITV
jgi:hypothetical protein